MSENLENNAKIDVNFNIKDISKLDGRSTKKLETTAKIFNNSLIELTKGINKANLELGKSVVKLSSQMAKAAVDISKISSGEIKQFKDNIGSLLNGTSDAINNIPDVGKEALDSAKSMAGVVSKVSDTINAFKNIDDKDVADSTNKIGTFTSSLANDLSKFALYDRKLIAEVSGLVRVFNKLSVGVKDLNKLTANELNDALRKEDMVSQHRYDRMVRMNEETRIRAQESSLDWFKQIQDVGLIKSLLGYDKRVQGPPTREGIYPTEHITGKLGQSIKTGILNGLKGALIGVVVGLVLKAIKLIGKVLVAPLNIAKKLATTVFGFLRKSLTSAETFKKLIELVMLPFTLLFTLLFAPILVKLAPLLVDLVNQVVGKWGVLEGVGEKIATILEYFFDEDQWFSFGNMIDTLIGLLDELSTIAFNAFNSVVDAGLTGLDVLTTVAVNLIFAIADKIIAFMVSPECYSLMTSIGMILGYVIYNGIKVAIATLAPLFEGIGGLLSGLIGAVVYDSFRLIVSNIKDILSSIPVFGAIASSLFGDVNAGEGVFSKTEDALSKLGTQITNNYNSIVNNNTYPSGIGIGYQQSTHKGSDY